MTVLMNAVVKMKRLGKVLQRDVRQGKPGIFRNTIITDQANAYGYDRDGKPYLIDAEDAPVVARYLWYTDKDGFLLTDQLRHRNGKPVKMEELIMGVTD